MPWFDEEEDASPAAGDVDLQHGDVDQSNNPEHQHDNPPQQSKSVAQQLSDIQAWEAAEAERKAAAEAGALQAEAGPPPGPPRSSSGVEDNPLLGAGVPLPAEEEGAGVPAEEEGAVPPEESPEAKAKRGRILFLSGKKISTFAGSVERTRGGQRTTSSGAWVLSVENPRGRR